MQPFSEKSVQISQRYGKGRQQKNQNRMQQKLIDTGPGHTAGKNIPAYHPIVFFHDHNKNQNGADRPEQQVFQAGPHLAMTE